VHRTYRPHFGVDYAAPPGARVVSVANGVVVSAGWAGGGGRQVRIRHAGGLESYYLHLSAFARGIRSGVHVDQDSSSAAWVPAAPRQVRTLIIDSAGTASSSIRAASTRGSRREPIPAALLADFQAGREVLAQQIVAALPAMPGGLQPLKSNPGAAKQ
jgi:hypothetical protein